MPILLSILERIVPGPFGKSSSVWGGGCGVAGRDGAGTGDMGENTLKTHGFLSSVIIKIS
jgi:hypothetical protein